MWLCNSLSTARCCADLLPRRNESPRSQITVDLGLGDASCVVFGNDLTHEYVSENADYRS